MFPTLISLIIIMFFAMMSPGPDMILLMKNGICYSRRNALLTVQGIVVGLAFHISLAILGLSIIISSNDTIYTVIKYAGALYLLYVGVQSIREKADDLQLSQGQIIHASAATAFRDGLVCNLLNVKATLFILSVFTQLIPPELPLSARLAFGGVMLFEALTVWSLFVLVIQTTTVQRIVRQYRLHFSRMFGAILTLLAVRIFFQ